MSSYTVRDWVTIGLFGALWGVVEISLGSFFHAIFPPQSNTFLTGLVMAGIGVVVVLTGRHFVPRRGSVLLIGVVTALIKLLSPGGAVIGPIVAILVESLLMEAVLWFGHVHRLWMYIVGGALAVGWNFPHKFVMMRLLYGVGFAQVLNKLIQDGSETLGVDASAVFMILGVLLGARLIVGAAGGWGAWVLGGAVARRLGRSAASEVKD